MNSTKRGVVVYDLLPNGTELERELCQQFRQEVESAVRWLPPGVTCGIDKRPSGTIAHDIDVTAFGTVHESLSHITVDDQFSALDDLSQLILGIAVDLYFHAADARGQVVT